MRVQLPTGDVRIARPWPTRPRRAVMAVPPLSLAILPTWQTTPPAPPPLWRLRAVVVRRV